MGGSRRSYLETVGALLGSTAIAGCSGVDSLASGRDPVEVLAAGSLQRAFETELVDAVDDPVALEARGSAAAARLVASGQRDPDVLALADVALFADLLQDAWYASVATNALAIATADSDGGRAIERADRWFDPVVDGRASLGRTDPDLDPLGYRTLFALELAADHYDHPGLRNAVIAPDQVYPETALLSGLETGTIDAAVVYETMAAERDYDFLDLPPEVDLSDPGHETAYERATYDLPDGTVRGDVVEYGATLRAPDDPAARRVFDAVVDGDVLATSGFPIPEQYPRYSENAPDALVDR